MGCLKEGGIDRSNGKKKSIILLGPWGGNGGTNWDDGTYHGVREITIVYDRCIDSIREVYDKNGKSIPAEKHGGLGGNRTAEIKLQYPEEFLVTVCEWPLLSCSAWWQPSYSITHIQEQIKGPLGHLESKKEPHLLSQMDGGLIVGFNGRSGRYLDAIGFRLSRVQTTKLFQRVQKSLRKLTSTASESSAPKDGEIRSQT